MGTAVTKPTQDCSRFAFFASWKPKAFRFSCSDFSTDCGFQFALDRRDFGILWWDSNSDRTAFLLSGEMASAYFMAHAPASFFPIVNHGELAVLYCFVFLYFAAAGGGPWSVDHVLRSRSST